MQKRILENLKRLAEEGAGLSAQYEFERWWHKLRAFMESAIGLGSSQDLDLLSAKDAYNEHALRLGHLQGIIAREEAIVQAANLAPGKQTAASDVVPSPTPSMESKKVFVVHGHDPEAKETTARFLEKLGLQPIILHEQPNGGRMIMEKFENYSGDIAFAVVLLTPDDIGAAAANPGAIEPRARQNVVMELGYFIGRLGRSRVCPLVKGGVELPSDYQGVAYIDMDSAGAWKAKVAQELVHANIRIELRALLG